MPARQPKLRFICIGCESCLTADTRTVRQRARAPRLNITAPNTEVSPMARAKSAGSSGGRARDAIALLKADHRQVEEWFEQFDKARNDDRKQELATQICNALKVHTTIEEEIFYPAFLEATDDTDIHHEAEVEHDGAKKLIAEIEASSPDDEYFAAKVRVLAEMIKHHVKEEEKSDGMFGEARNSDMDLVALGEQLAARKAELEGQSEDDDDMPPPRGQKERSQPGRSMKDGR
jgi:hemerythrin superfamily protein